MKTLSLLRHAKTEAISATMHDHDRALTARGIGDAQRLGQQLMAEGMLPDLVLCSSSVRTVQTWQQLCQQIEKEIPLMLLDTLYLASAEDMLQLLHTQVPDNQQHVMVIGHNPGMYGLAAMLATDGTPAALRRMEAGFPTCALARIRCDIVHWHELGGAKNQLEQFSTPDQPE